uniref:Uncharacterized protein n=1 Tax=Anguilla anguilla TaxID=7936 RepID=A0A0E9WM09_ANGAN
MFQINKIWCLEILMKMSYDYISEKCILIAFSNQMFFKLFAH